MATKTLLHPHTRNRSALRQLLKNGPLLKPVSVFDPLSAKMAERNGAKAIQLAGSVAAHVIAGVPDLMLVTSDEVAALCKRLSRGREIPLIIDADHGYGSALTLRRCIEEFCDSGVSGLTLEDTALPAGYGSTGKSIQGSAGGFSLTSIDEHVNKLKSAVAAKPDPSMVIMARTSAYCVGGVAELCQRVQAYATTGVDGLHFIGKPTIEEFAQIKKAAAGLPLMVSGAQAVPEADLHSYNVRIKLEGHQPFLAAQQAALSAIRGDGPATIPSTDLEDLLEVSKYKSIQREYLAIENPAAGMK